MSKTLKIAIISLSILSIISAIGVFGYNLLNKDDEEGSKVSSEENNANEQENEETNSEETQQAEDNEVEDLGEQETSTSDYEGWTQVTFEACKVTLFYPSDWKVSRYDAPSKCADITSPDSTVNMTVNGEFTDDPVTYFENKPTGRPGVSEEIFSRIIDGKEYPYVIETIEELGTTYYIFYKSGNTYYVSSWSGNGVSNYTSTIDKIVDSIDVLQF